jgi:hypothetical protein
MLYEPNRTDLINELFSSEDGLNSIKRTLNRIIHRYTKVEIKSGWSLTEIINFYIQLRYDKVKFLIERKYNDNISESGVCFTFYIRNDYSNWLVANSL